MNTIMNFIITEEALPIPKADTMQGGSAPCSAAGERRDGDGSGGPDERANRVFAEDEKKAAPCGAALCLFGMGTSYFRMSGRAISTLAFLLRSSMKAARASRR
jgi:hypothetical protein